MAMQFDNTGNAYLESLTNYKPLDITGDISITAWVYLLNDTSVNYIATKLNQYEFYVNLKELEFLLYDTEGNPQTISGGVNANISTNSFYFIAVTNRKPNVNFYINGNLVSQQTLNYNIQSSDSHFLISDDTVRPMMKVEDVRIYNRKLSNTEIKNIYQKKGLDEITNGLVGRWKLNEYPDGTIAYGNNSIIDVSGYDNHLTPYYYPVYKEGIIISGNNIILDFVDWYQKNPIENYFTWKTYTIEYENGVTDRRKVWSRPIRRWKINWTDLKKDKRDKIIEFFNAIAFGAYQSFLLKDRYDYEGVSKFIGDGTTTTFQLYKSYYGGAWKETKKDIIPGSVKVRVHGVELTSGYTISPTTGLIVFDTAPSEGDDIEVTFEYYFRVVFTSDELLDRKILPGIWEYDQMEVREVR